jgi:hypothetical protein
LHSSTIPSFSLAMYSSGSRYSALQTNKSLSHQILSLLAGTHAGRRRHLYAGIVRMECNTRCRILDPGGMR